MTEKRFIMSQNGNFHTVIDTVEKKPLGMFEFKENEFPVYACFHRIIDLMNDLSDENEQLKKILGFLKNDNANAIVDVLNLQQTTIGELNRENEQLKNNLSEIEKIVSELEVEKIADMLGVDLK